MTKAVTEDRASEDDYTDSEISGSEITDIGTTERRSGSNSGQPENAAENARGDETSAHRADPSGETRSDAVFLHGASADDRLDVARRLHAHSPWSEGPFVVAALTEALTALRGELLFGVQPVHERSEAPSRPGYIAQAAGGTLLVDELDCLAPPLQERFAVLLQNASPGLRIVVASRHDPDLLLAYGALAPALKAWLASLDGRHVLGPARLRAVQQLTNDGGASGPAGLAAALEASMRSYVEAALEAGVQDLRASVVSAVERPLISLVLRHTLGNQVRAAALLGLNRNTLRKRVRELNISLRRAAQERGEDV